MAITQANIDPTSQTLLQLSSLIQKTISSYISHRQSTIVSSTTEDGLGIPSRPLFDAQRTLLAAAGKLTELVSSPQTRLIEVANQYFEARALHVVADKRIPDILAKREKGVSVTELSQEVGIEARKLSRLLRCLCSIHIFNEIEEDVFANNDISRALVGNEPLRAYIMLL